MYVICLFFVKSDDFNAPDTENMHRKKKSSDAQDEPVASKNLEN